MSAGSSGAALIPILLISAALGLAAMAAGAYGLWVSALRFPEATVSRTIAQGFTGLVCIGLLFSFCYGLYTIIRPLVVPTPGSADKLNGLLVILAPATTGLFLTLYFVVAIVVLRLAHWLVAD